MHGDKDSGTGLTGQTSNGGGGQMALRSQLVGMAALGHQDTTATEELPQPRGGACVPGVPQGPVPGLDSNRQGSPAMPGPGCPYPEGAVPRFPRISGGEFRHQEGEARIQDVVAVSRSQVLQVPPETVGPQYQEGLLPGRLGAVLQGEEEWRQIPHVIGVQMAEENVRDPRPG